MGTNRFTKERFLKEYYKITYSYYYRYVLSYIDKLVFTELCRRILYTDSIHKYVMKYRLLYCNIKIKTIAENIGISVSSVKRSLTTLDKLGVIIKDPTERNKRGELIFLGFALDESASDRKYLIEHLVGEFDSILEKNIEDRLKNKKSARPSASDRDFFRLDPDYRHFLSDNIFNPQVIANRPIQDNKTIYEILFNEKAAPTKGFTQSDGKILIKNNGVIDDDI